MHKGRTDAESKGSGKVKGALAPNGKPHRFMLWATDGPTSSFWPLWPAPSSPDTFRIMTWWEGTGGAENVVYGTGVEQPIAGGTITVIKGF